MKNHLIFSLFIVSILTLCACTVDSAGGQPSADAQTPKSLALGNLGHGSAADMVYVEGGTFQMGSTKNKNKYKKSVCTVTVSSFYMGRYEVTQAEYAEIMGNNPSKFKGERRPVEMVTWYDAVNYCNKRSEKEGLTPCYTIDGTDVTCNWSANGYRLPTEAEWEYAARGGIHKSPYEYSISNIEEVAWYCENSGSKTHGVGKKRANVLGIHDMSGNVCEWCWDWYGDYSNNAERDPLGPASGSRRVNRGGGWHNNASHCRCAYRNNFYPSSRGNDLGFRVVRSAITADSTGGQLTADMETTKKLAFGNIEHDRAPDMVYVESGAFKMGSTKNDEESIHHIVFVSSFYMCKYEVTQAEYKKIMGHNPSRFKGDRRPVERVTWYKAVEYCNKRSEKEGLMPCYSGSGDSVICNWNANGYRLPTEAEWEYAARGGIHKSPYKYSGSNNIKEVAWYCYNSGSKTHGVGKKRANALGIYDMSGNVCEWCWDWYGDYSSNAENEPRGPASGGRRVLRGGSWSDNADYCRCARRYHYGPSYRYGNLGFRVVRSTITADSAEKWSLFELKTPRSLIFGNLEHGLAADMVYVEGGTFQMGCDTSGDIREKPEHEVTVSSFYMGKYEVTQAEYKKIMRHNPSRFKGERRPVERVTWYDAVNYCNERSKAEKLTPCYAIDGTNVTCNWGANGYRLPTEAEWEYAARGGIHKSAFEYSGSNNIKEVAWYYHNSDNQTHEVGTSKANVLELYDMSGNVYEWCWDWYNNSYCSNRAVSNPNGPASGSYRVIRGGSWGINASFCRCAARGSYDPDGRSYNLGFRVVRSCK